MRNQKQPDDKATVKFKLSSDLSEDDLELGTFKGVASVFGNTVDTFPPTIIEKGAFKKTLKENFDRVKLLWQHEINNPIGKPVTLKETDEGLEVVGQISMTNQGRDAIRLVRDEVITDMSIGFDPVKWKMEKVEPEKKGKDPIASMFGFDEFRRITELKLWEISFVTWGADDKAKIRAVQSLPFQDLPFAGFDYQCDPTEAHQRIEDWANGDATKLSRAYLFRNREGVGCSYQIADVIGGRLYVVPKLLFQIAARLETKPELASLYPIHEARAHLARYFERLSQSAEPPANPNDSRSLTTEEMDRQLMNAQLSQFHEGRKDRNV